VSPLARPQLLAARPQSETSVRIRLTPRETSFYTMFTESARNLVAAASLLKDLLAAEPAGPRSPRRCATSSTRATRRRTGSCAS
jgi:hypothetical protein